MENLTSTVFKNKFVIKKHSSYRQISNYDLKQTIGKGGFAKVKRATHKLTGEDVAVKIINKAQMSYQDLQRLQRQIYIHKKMIHQNIIRIYEVYEDSVNTYIFMELSKNGQLFDQINKNGPMEEEKAARIFIQIYYALLYMHKQKIAHRDLKVENILLDFQMNAKIADFGLAVSYQKDGQQLMLKTFCGSPAYTPPQIIKRSSYNGKSTDVWCLGVTLYAMLAAQLPFGASVGQRLKNRILDCNYYIKSNFSFEAQKLLMAIFKHQEHRISLQQIANSDFFKKYGHTDSSNFVNTQVENLVVDQEVLNQIERIYKVPKQKVQESVINIRPDEFNALYYLTVQSNLYKGKMSDSDLCSPNFKKCEKQPRRKLERLVRPPLLHLGSLDSKLTKSTTISPTRKLGLNRNSSSLKRQNLIVTGRINLIHEEKRNGNFRVRISKPSVDINRCRLRQIDESPESPKRILDCMKGYN